MIDNLRRGVFAPLSVVLAVLLFAIGCEPLGDDPVILHENTTELCSDGIDNDGDGAIDCNDFDCVDLGFCP